MLTLTHSRKYPARLAIKLLLVALQHTVHQVSKGAPVVPPTRQAVLVHKEHVLLEARVEVRLQTQLADHGVVVAVDVRVDTVHALEDLADQRRE